jgi:hypothetical protein
MTRPRLWLTLAALCLCARAHAQYDISKPFDEDGCVNRAIAEANQQDLAIAQKYKPRRGASSSMAPGEQTEEKANQDILQARKDDCASQMRLWQQLKDQSIAAQIAAIQAKGVGAIRAYEAQPAAPPPPPPAGDGHTPIWGFVIYNTADPGPDPKAGPANEDFVSEAMDLAPLANNHLPNFFLDKCVPDMGPGWNNPSVAFFGHVEAKFLVFLQRRFGIQPEGSCATVGGLFYGRIWIYTSAEKFPVLDPQERQNCQGDGCPFRSLAEADQLRRKKISESRRYVVQVHASDLY